MSHPQDDDGIFELWHSPLDSLAITHIPFPQESLNSALNQVVPSSRQPLNET